MKYISKFKIRRSLKRFREEGGISLIESMIAAALLVTTVAGLLSLFSVMLGRNAGQGEDATRTTEYAQDKMEQLMALAFTDTASDTTKFPTASSGGQGLSVGGGITQGSPVTGYVDYLDKQGNLLTTSTGAFYTRQWQITVNSTGRLKTVTVVAWANYKLDAQGALPSTTLVCIKANF